MGEEVSTVETEQGAVVKQSRSPLVPRRRNLPVTAADAARTVNVSSPVRENEKEPSPPLLTTLLTVTSFRLQ